MHLFSSKALFGYDVPKRTETAAPEDINKAVNVVSVCSIYIYIYIYMNCQ